MKAKHLFLAIAALLAAGGLWLARSTWRSESSTDAAFQKPSDGPKAGQMLQPPKPGQMLRPPNPSRLFTDFTPEQRVEFARKGHGPGG